MWEKYAVNVVVALSPITLINFIAFMCISLYLGGSAVNGKIVSEHYYLGEHGIYTEVSYRVFLYSKVHTYFTISTFVVLMGLMFLLAIKGKKYYPHER